LALMRGLFAKPSGLPPPRSTVTRVVSPFRTSRTKTSGVAYSSPSTRSEARERKATRLPLALMDAS
jgi:hypothetical protein